MKEQSLFYTTVVLLMLNFAQERHKTRHSLTHFSYFCRIWCQFRLGTVRFRRDSRNHGIVFFRSIPKSQKRKFQRTLPLIHRKHILHVRHVEKTVRNSGRKSGPLPSPASLVRTALPLCFTFPLSTFAHSMEATCWMA